ncbi:hypothetical protein EDB82DRAFT_487464 [Fusarium venenatum]|uniref:uncharacterized protein n=1 Tax=Fusarium venenatum TaxID=56646 RepID=UPI001D974FB0|nr:hypothetical protein EDB82DRAFT_487464 [Fusarium venenatum]
MIYSYGTVLPVMVMVIVDAVDLTWTRLSVKVKIPGWHINYLMIFATCPKVGRSCIHAGRVAFYWAYPVLLVVDHQ